MKGDFRLNGHGRYDQDDAVVAALDGGGFVAVWTDSDQDGSRGLALSGVYARVFDAKGHPLGHEFRVHDRTGWRQSEPSVTALDDGGFAVGWNSDGRDSHGRKDPYVDAYVRFFDADGTARTDEVQISPGNTQDHWLQDMATLADGSVVAVTASSNVATDWRIRAHRLDAEGDRIGGPATLERRADTGEANVYVDTRPAADVSAGPHGGYGVTWWEVGPGAALDRIHARTFGSGGSPKAPERVITGLRAGEFDKDDAKITALDDGRFAVAWTTRMHEHDYDQLDAWFRILNADGTPAGPERLVNAGDREDAQVVGDVTALGNGMSLVTYASYNPRLSDFPDEINNIMGRLFGPDGRPLSVPFLLGEYAYEEGELVQATVLRSGKLMIVWDGGEDLAKDVWGRIIDLGAKQAGSGGADRLTGGLLADTLRGRGGGDVLLGAAGDDRLEGGAGRDRISGGDGADRLAGGKGADSLTGGPGADRFEFASVADSRNSARDTIHNFGGNDRVDLSGIDAERGQPGNQAFAWIGRSDFDGVAGELRRDHGVLMGDVDGDGHADFAIRFGHGAHVGQQDVIL